jgi:serine/threonine-protein kinase
MILDNGIIKITDFGIAMSMNATQLTQTNSVMGSVHYLPPEQASGKGATVKSDIYSMGIIFYELLTGKLPFKGDNAVEIALKQMRNPLPSIREENSEIPQSVENIIVKAAAKNPKNRYEDSRGMHEDLLTCLNDDRMDEAPIKFKYPEHEASETKRIKKIEDLPKEKDKVDDLGQTHDLSTKIEDIEDKRSRKLIIILSSILAVALIAIIFVFVIFPNISKTKNITVPSCVGNKVSVCQAKLEKAGFTVNSSIKETYSDEVEENRVVKTTPAEGRVVKKGSKITIYKALGPETFKLEDYTGKVCVEVKANLESKYELVVNCEKKEVTEAVEDSTLIISQSPEAGTEVKKGESVTLYIPNQVEIFPDIIGEKWSMDDIDAFCKKYEITKKVVKQATTLDEPGTIIAVSRRPGTSIVKGSTLTVTVAEKPKETNCTTFADETSCKNASCKWDTVTNACS